MSDRPIFRMDTMRTALELTDGYRFRLEIAREALEWIAGQADRCCTDSCQGEMFAQKALDALRKISK